MNSRSMRYEVKPAYQGYTSWLIALAALALWCGHAMGQGEWRPSRNVEFVVQAGAGGASDRTARTLQKIMQDKRLLESPSTVINKVGGGGALAYNYVNQHAGDAHFVLMTSGTLMTSYVVGQSPFRHTDFTPLAILCSEYTVFVVRADSPFKDGKALLARLASSPQEVRIALSPGLGNANHIALAMVVKAAGGDVKRLKIAVFASAAETVTALLGGHVDLVLAPASPVLPHVAASTVRVLAVSSAQRLPAGLASAPTWKEMGVDGVFGNWRGMMGPKGLAEPQVAYWSGVFSRVASTSEWKEDLDKNLLSPLFIGGNESRQFLDAEHKQISALMKDIGLAK